MKSFNLLKEVQNYRNTVLPGSPIPGSGARLFLPQALSVFFLLVILTFAGGLWVIETNSPVKAIVIRKFLSFTGLNEDKTAPMETQIIEARPEDNLPEPIAKKVESQKETEPDEKSFPLFLKPIASRPVAMEAALNESNRPEQVWSVRFAVCVYKKSCEEVRAKLRKKGISSYLAKSSVSILTHYVLVGPWNVKSSVDHVARKLKAAGVGASLFSIENKYYLSTRPTATGKTAGETLKKVWSMGYRARMASKKGPQSMYKVYSGAFKDRKRAKKELRGFTNRGIECVLEKHG